MLADVLSVVGSVVIAGWGIAHVVPTRSVVQGLGELSPDGRRIATMGWVAEGLTLCFVGALVALVTIVRVHSLPNVIGDVGRWRSTGTAVTLACAAMLISMAVLSLATGARTAILPMKLCPVVKTVVAALYAVAALVR